MYKYFSDNLKERDFMFLFELKFHNDDHIYF